MKTILRTLPLFALCASLAMCTKLDDPQAFATSYEADQVIPYEGGTVTFNVYAAPGDHWTIEWITDDLDRRPPMNNWELSQLEGTGNATITVSAEEGAEYVIRHDLVVTCADQRQALRITQASQEGFRCQALQITDWNWEGDPVWSDFTQAEFSTRWWLVSKPDWVLELNITQGYPGWHFFQALYAHNEMMHEEGELVFAGPGGERYIIPVSIDIDSD